MKGGLRRARLVRIQAFRPTAKGLGRTEVERPVSIHGDRARQPDVRRNCLRNFAGVMPVISLKSRVK